MGTNSLIDKTDPHDIVAADWNEIHTALAGDFTGRKKVGATSAAASNQKLGTQALPWGEAHVGSLFVGGTLIDFGNLGTGADNGVISSATRTTSGQPDFLRADGTAATVTVLGATTALSFNVDGQGTVINTDIAVASLTTAPSTNNTCLINDTGLSDQHWTIRHGEGTLTINVDAAGSEITDRVGQFASFAAPSGEIFYGFIKSATEIVQCSRGFYLDSTGTEPTRETLADNDTLTLMATNWIFAENNGTTVTFTDVSPIVSHTEPASPALNDYWFDVEANTWKRYNGSDFEQINRVLVGYAVCDGTGCVGARSADYAKAYADTMFLELEGMSSTQIKTKNEVGTLSVFANTLNYVTSMVWDITTDLEAGLTEASSTLYYLYVTENGDSKISTTPPYQKQQTLKGYYHPHQSWRCVGVAYNDSSSNFVFTSAMDDAEHKKHTNVDVIDELHVSAPLAASMIGVMSDEHDSFCLQLTGITSSSSTTLYLQVSSDYGLTTVGNAHFVATIGGTVKVGGTGGSTSVSTGCATSVPSSGSPRARLTANFSQPNNGIRSVFDFVYSSGNSSTPSTAHKVAGIAGHINAINVGVFAGTITNGSFTLYGYRKSYDERWKIL